MARIRTLKPEAPQHRKVGRLSIWARWLWVVMITQADDEGRLVADPGQLRVVAFGYDKTITDGRVMQCLEEVQSAGLIRLYSVEGTLYADFPSWGDHQRISHPCKSKLPKYHDSGILQNVPESSSTIKDQGVDQGRDQGSRNGSGVVMSDDQFIETLQTNPAYQGIDVRTELAKMDAWLLTPKARGRKKTRQFIVNWLNRVDKPVAGTTSPFDARTAENIRAGQAVLDRLKGERP